MARDWQAGCRLLMLHLRARMTRRRRRVLVGPTALAVVAAAVGAYLLPWPPELDGVATGVLALTLVLGVGSAAALICLTVFARIRGLGWGPKGLTTPELLQEIHRARRERHLPILSDAQQEFMVAQSRHIRLALPWTILLQFVLVPLLPAFVVSVLVFGAAPTVWTTAALLVLTAGNGAYHLALLGRTTAFLPIEVTADRPPEPTTDETTRR